jgi:tRNA (guanine-N7-)-methyltransferase
MEELEPYLLHVPESAAVLDWTQVFGNDHPVEVEIGFGKGLFLVTAGQTSPGVNFLGIEIIRKYQLFTATRLAKRGLRNVRLVKADARQFLHDCIRDQAVRALHVYFPDPWWKKRHLKRRVFTPEFAGQCQRVLETGGRLTVMTDVEEYFQVIVNLLSRHSQLECLAAPELGEPKHELDYCTNFERKFRKEGRAIYGGVWEKVSSSNP